MPELLPSKRNLGDGNGLLENSPFAGGVYISCPFADEPAVFWRDLSFAGMIPNTFNTVTWGYATITFSDQTDVDKILPKGKKGNNYVYTWSGGMAYNNGGNPNVNANDNTNYFGLANVYAPGGWSTFSGVGMKPGLTQIEAQAIDAKIDDGFAMSGSVIAAIDATYRVNYSNWVQPALPNLDVVAYSRNCFDNGGNGSQPAKYALGNTSYLGGVVCALSFKF